MSLNSVTNSSYTESETTSQDSTTRHLSITEVSDELSLPEEIMRHAVNNNSLTPTHEIRLLRAQIGSMEEKLRELQSKWTSEVSNKRMLAMAQYSAREKRAVTESEQEHQELQQMLHQQQILFAKLQTAVLHAPLQPNGNEVFEALHFDTLLGRESNERERILQMHLNRSRATIPSIVDKICQESLEKARERQQEQLPLSQIEITGCRDYTLISSVVVTEIPHPSLEDVYAALVVYFEAIPRSMHRHFGVNVKRTRLNDETSQVLYRRTRFQGPRGPVIINNVLTSDLTPSHGMFHLDVILNDPLHPVHDSALTQYGICGLTVTPVKEVGKTVAVTLRFVTVHCYNMLPHDPILQEDLDMIRPLLNGDLITASVGEYLQKLEKSTS